MSATGTAATRVVTQPSWRPLKSTSGAPARAISRWLPSAAAAQAEHGRYIAELQTWKDRALVFVGGVLFFGMLASVLVVWILAVFTGDPMGTGVLVGVALVILAGLLFSPSRQATRADETIESFARSFNLREVDPWVVRAVWEAAEEYCGWPPLRSDRLWYDMFDHEDDVEILAVITLRSMRDPEGLWSDPGPIETVGDLVETISGLPRVDLI